MLLVLLRSLLGDDDPRQSRSSARSTGRWRKTLPFVSARCTRSVSMGIWAAPIIFSWPMRVRVPSLTRKVISTPRPSSTGRMVRWSILAS
ncbi:MAG: hypothetical protein ACI906_002398 [Candidatus Latescibacterota bacterium]|jgi:hypothetical protein